MAPSEAGRIAKTSRNPRVSKAQARLQEEVNKMANQNYEIGVYEDMRVLVDLAKKGYSKSSGMLTENNMNLIREAFPQVKSLTTYKRPGADLSEDHMYRFGMKDGSFTDVIVTNKEKGLTLATVIDSLNQFFGIPVKRKKPTLSKKQRELKKIWLLK